MTTDHIYAVGRRKTATAQIRLFAKKGQNKINGKPINLYVKRKDLFETLLLPLRALKLKDDFSFEAKVSGSGESAQVAAISLAIARALSEDTSRRAVLKGLGLLTRDARKVERKKPGRHKARKGMQWSKR